MVAFRILKKTSAPLRGYSLVEMMVALAIIVIITTIAVTGQSTFNRSLLLTDTAYTVAFSIREAQTLGLSSRVYSSQPDAGYGIRFSAATRSTYHEFADIYPASPGSTQSGLCPGHTVTDSSNPDAHPGNCLYDSSTELVRTYTLNRGFYVASVCGTASSGTKCTATDFDYVHITFMRPSTNAVILGYRNGVITSLSDATVKLYSPDGLAYRCVLVSKVGQVAVVNPGSVASCP